jgi:hypothetical protein
VARRPGEPNRLNSQEWSAYFQREAEDQASEPPDALDSLIEMLERGLVDRSDPRLERLRSLLEETGRS